MAHNSVLIIGCNPSIFKIDDWIACLEKLGKPIVKDKLEVHEKKEKMVIDGIKYVQFMGEISKEGMKDMSKLIADSKAVLL